jgi:hypothetical protein
MLYHRINTTLNSDGGTEFFCSIQLKIAIMQRSLTYLILFIRLVVKSIIIIPRRWNRKGDIVLALSVRLNFVSGLVLCNY